VKSDACMHLEEFNLKIINHNVLFWHFACYFCPLDDMFVSKLLEDKIGIQAISSLQSTDMISVLNCGWCKDLALLKP
jgi:hypothetical protein